MLSYINTYEIKSQQDFLREDSFDIIGKQNMEIKDLKALDEFFYRTAIAE